MASMLVGADPGVSTPTRAGRLPVYFLLDCSSSMAGEPLSALLDGLEQFRAQVGSDANADQVYVAVITFADTAKRVGGLVPIHAFSPSSLRLIAGGSTRLDLALSTLQTALLQDLVQSGQEPQTHFEPMVFVFTDGNPTNAQGYVNDDWVGAREALLRPPWVLPSPVTIVAIGCGPNVTDDTLRELSTGSWRRSGNDSGAFTADFRYVSETVLSAVRIVGRALFEANSAADRANTSALSAREHADKAGAHAASAGEDASSARMSVSAARDEATKASSSAETARSQAAVASDYASSAENSAIVASAQAEVAAESARRAGGYVAIAEGAVSLAGAEAGIAEESAEIAIQAAIESETPVVEPRPRPARRSTQAQRRTRQSSQ
jgi:uncharacterized protein YegL